MCMVWCKKAGKWVLYPIIGILICSVWKVSIKYATSPIQIYTTINPNVEGESAQEMYAFLLSLIHIYLETEKAIDNSGRISGILSFDVGMVGYR